MRTYVLQGGSHRAKGFTYKKGDFILSDSDLVTKFRGKFVLAPEGSVDSHFPVDVPWMEDGQDACVKPVVEGSGEFKLVYPNGKESGPYTLKAACAKCIEFNNKTAQQRVKDIIPKADMPKPPVSTTLQDEGGDDEEDPPDPSEDDDEEAPMKIKKLKKKKRRTE